MTKEEMGSKKAIIIVSWLIAAMAWSIMLIKYMMTNNLSDLLGVIVLAMAVVTLCIFLVVMPDAR